MRRRQGVGKNLRKNGNLPYFCMSLSESLSFSVILKKCFSKIIRLGVRCASVCACVCVCVCVCVEGEGARWVPL